MKKLILLTSVFMVLLLSGCNEPCVEYLNSAYTYDSQNRTIILEEGYVLSDNHPYDVVETEDGYDMTLHFEKESSHG